VLDNALLAGNVEKKEDGLRAIGNQLIPIPEQAPKFRPRYTPSAGQDNENNRDLVKY
jgi:hypothetical protein